MGMQEATWNPPASGASAPPSDPREGSAAWRAEQITNGNIPIPGMRAPSFGPPVQTQATATPSFAPLLGLLIKLGVVVAIALFVWLRFLHSGAPSDEELQATFVPISGYEYAENDSEMAAWMEHAIGSMPAVEDVMSGYEVKEIFSNGQMVAVGMVAGFDPADLADEDPAAFGEGAVSAGARPVSFGGTSAYQINQGTATQYMWLDEDGYLFVVVGMYPNHANTVASALAAGNI